MLHRAAVRRRDRALKGGLRPPDVVLRPIERLPEMPPGDPPRSTDTVRDRYAGREEIERENEREKGQRKRKIKKEMS